jgi:hypothetical protein
MVVKIIVDIREGFFQGVNDLTVKNRNICIDFITIFFNIIEKILLQLVEFYPDDRIGLTLLVHTTESRLLAINLLTFQAGELEILMFCLKSGDIWPIYDQNGTKR